MRAIAVLLVMGRHLPAPDSNESSIVGACARFISEAWHRGGWIGVDLFFVLSGFLVSGLLFREHQKFGSISSGRFLIRRGFKIYPAFWVLLLVTVAEAYFIHRQFHPKAILSELFFVQNYAYPHWNHTWSLAVEEHFYLILLLLFLFLARGRPPNPFKCIPGMYLALAFISLVLRIVTALLSAPAIGNILLPSHLRMDSLFCGVTISYLYHYFSDGLFVIVRCYRILFLVGGSLAVAPAFVFPVETSPFILTFGLTLFQLGGACILLGLLYLSPGKSIAIDTTAYIGSHSYSIYLWHMPVLIWVMPTLGRHLGNWPSYCVIYVICAGIIGILMALLIEFPVLRMRDKWFPSSGPGLAVKSPSSERGMLDRPAPTT